MVYDSAAERGLGPREIDELELWEVAAVLGGNRAPHVDRPEAPQAARGPHPWNVARAIALEQGLPEPQHDGHVPSPQEHARTQAFLQQSAAYGLTSEVDGG